MRLARRGTDSSAVPHSLLQHLLGVSTTVGAEAELYLVFKVFGVNPF